MKSVQAQQPDRRYDRYIWKSILGYPRTEKSTFLCIFTRKEPDYGDARSIAADDRPDGNVHNIPCPVPTGRVPAVPGRHLESASRVHTVRVHVPYPLYRLRLATALISICRYRYPLQSPSGYTILVISGPPLYCCLQALSWDNRKSQPPTAQPNLNHLLPALSPSLQLSIYLSICLSVYPSICLSIYLSAQSNPPNLAETLAILGPSL
ncbi:hypothetical protein F4861DRAFT_12543 [Xylaria intraflava]|nr:hypothetical protein F4861DRAFT_12543 [Xylaria intraflava]